MNFEEFEKRIPRHEIKEIEKRIKAEADIKEKQIILIENKTKREDFMLPNLPVILLFVTACNK